MPIPRADTSSLEGGLFADRRGTILGVAIMFMVLCTLILILRFISRRSEKRPICAEDWIMIPAWIVLMGHCAGAICGVRYGGMGRHEAYVLQYEPEAMVSWAQVLFATSITLGIAIPLEKTSILLLYIRIFRVHHWFRYANYLLIAYIWMWGLSVCLVTILACKPVPFQWEQYAGATDGVCIDQLAFFRWVGPPNIIHDVVMLVIPLPVVWKLQMQLRQKLALSCVFLVGSLQVSSDPSYFPSSELMTTHEYSGCVASSIRTALFFQLNAFSDNTWASIDLISWIVAEPGAIFICACMPALWPMIVHYGPSMLKLRSSKVQSDRYVGDIEGMRSGFSGAYSGNQRSNLGTGEFIRLSNFEDGSSRGTVQDHFKIMNPPDTDFQASDGDGGVPRTTYVPSPRGK
ncbi:hypothetical protein N8I77_005853 [Diaporthe amygdali]|uniref:Rhodopsin domain-containing protein n=1 Tax=Phomopsis amygdali TaxID=1214568 RepID=A0AAD9SHY8_PHOAM|nr:hypothetical protein N8I77_005853 [Diaporthe amygdali]